MSSKTTLVTGAGKGIGRAIALAVAEAGYDVGVHCGVSRDGAEAVAQAIRDMGRKAVVLQAEMASNTDLQAMYEQFLAEFGHIDLLVNNAGITRATPFLDVTEEQWDEVHGINLRGVFFCSQLAARSMVETGTRGVIINIGSTHAEGCFPDSTVYAASKAGLNKLGKNMAMELAAHGIRVATIAPGFTHRRLRSEMDEKDIPDRARKIMARIPLKRFAYAEEIGAAVVFLASENAGYITGTTLCIEGGSLLPVTAHNDYT